MTDTFYVLEALAENSVAEFYLNGIPIMRRGINGGESCKVQVNHLLIDGANKLSFTVDPGPIPSLAHWGEFGPHRPRKFESQQLVSLRLAKYPYGATSGGPEGVELAKLEWKPTPAETRTGAFTVGTTVELEPVFGRSKWQDAPEIKLDFNDQYELSAFLEEMHAAIASGDTAYFIAASSVRLDEINRAYRTNPAERRNALIRSMTIDATTDGFEMAPLDPREFDFRLCADKRMVELIAADWDPILRGGPDISGNDSYYDLIVSRIDGKWHVVR